MLIIPAIDLLGGRCVRLFQGDYARETVYDADPLEVARGFVSAGAEIVHVVDLDGARTGEPVNLPIVRRLAQESGARLEVGGGVRSLERARELLDAGVHRVVLGTKLVQDPQLAEQLFSALGESVVAGIDARNGFVSIHGWTEDSQERAAAFARRMQDLGARRTILTDVAKDGAMAGPNLELLREVCASVGIPVIASGGVSTLADVSTLAREPGVEAAIIGKALYEGAFNLSDAIGAST